MNVKMNVKRLGIMLSAITLPIALHFCPAIAEVVRPLQQASSSLTPEQAYQQIIAQIHRAATVDQLPTFSHSSPLNKVKLADARVEQKEVLGALKELTPRTLKSEGKVEFDNRTYLFYEGDPEKAAQLHEYFPVTAEMVKEDGKWKLRRQQSWHCKDGSPEAELIPKGQDRLKRFQDLMSALVKPVPLERAHGDIRGVKFKPNIAYFYPRENYFKLEFVDGQKKFSIYVREGADLSDLQGRHFMITPLDGFEADLEPDDELFGPYCAKVEFGKVDKSGVLPGAISLAVRTPESVNLTGLFGAVETEDTLSPGEEEKGKKLKVR